MTKLIFRLKGGKGSGHAGHRGRPGKRGGSQPGIGISVPYPKHEIEEEERLAKSVLEGMGGAGYMLVQGRNRPKWETELERISRVVSGEENPKVEETESGSMLQAEDWSKVPGGWRRYHPKAIHNYRLSASRETGLTMSKISDKLAERWGKGLITKDELLEELGIK